MRATFLGEYRVYTSFFITNKFFFLLIFSRAPSPRSSQTYIERIQRTTESPGSLSPSVHSSDDRPRSRTASHHSTRPLSQPGRAGNDFIKDITF